MNPPIPEPMAAPRIIERGPRPEAMKLFMAGAIFFTVIGLIYCDGTFTEYSVAADLVLYGVLSALWLFFLWRLWQGANWARIVIMIGCVLSILNLFALGDYTLLQQIESVADAAFSAAWLWWLRTPEVVAFTKGKPAGSF